MLQYIQYILSVDTASASAVPLHLSLHSLPLLATQLRISFRHRHPRPPPETNPHQPSRLPFLPSASSSAMQALVRPTGDEDHECSIPLQRDSRSSPVCPPITPPPDDVCPDPSYPSWAARVHVISLPHRSTAISELSERPPTPPHPLPPLR